MRSVNRSQRRLGVENLENRNLLTTLRPELVADLNQSQEIYDIDYKVVQIQDTTLFVANSSAHGTELFTSDGTDEGSTLWADLNPGFSSSNPTGFEVSPNGEFGLFKATINERNAIWHTDGTDAVPLVISGYRPEELEILSVTDQGAYIQRGVANEDGLGRRSAYVSDVFFVDGDTAQLSFLGAFDGVYYEGGVASHRTHARNEDGHMLFQNCADRCTVWSTDGTYLNTVPVAEFDESVQILELNGELYFRESIGYGEFGTTAFRYESGSDAVLVESELFGSFQIVGNDSGFLGAQRIWGPDLNVSVSRLVFAESLDSEPIVVLETGGNSFAAPVFATDSALMASISGENVYSIVAVDEVGDMNTILEIDDAGPGFGILLASDGDTVAIQFEPYAANEGGSASIWRTDGTTEGTQLVATDFPAWSRSTVEITNDKLWVSQISQDGRSITVFDGGEIESTITDQWSGRTTGVNDFGMEPFKDGYVAHSSEEVWLADATLDSFEPISQDDHEARVGQVFVLPDSVWYEQRVPGKLLMVNQGAAGTNMRVDLQVPGFSGYTNAQMVGDKMVLLAGVAEDPFSSVRWTIGSGNEVWVSDGTIEGTTKVYDNDTARVSFRASGGLDDNEIVIEISLPDSETIEWLVSDGTPAGTRLVDANDVPDRTRRVVTHTISGGITYTHSGQTWTATGPANEHRLDGDWVVGDSVAIGRVVYFTAFQDGDYGLFRIQPGNQNGAQFFEPQIERYLDLPLAESTLIHADGDLIVVHDDGYHGEEPYRIPIGSSPYFGSGELSCIDALELQRGIEEGIEDPFEINRLDLNGDFQLDQLDLDEWTRSIDVAGDVNVDGWVGAADLNIVGGNWNSQVSHGWCDGDLNGDGVVGATDLNIIGTNWPDGAALARTPLAPLAAQQVLVEDVPVVDGPGNLRIATGEAVDEGEPDLSPAAVDYALAGSSFRHREVARFFASSDVESQDPSDAETNDSLRHSWRRLRTASRRA